MNDLELRKLLAELSALRSEVEPIVSVYLDAGWTDEKQRERVRVFVEEATRRALDQRSEHPQREAFQRTLEKVRAAVDSRASQEGMGEGHGLAIFACESLGLWKELAFPLALRDELSVDARPHLLQLARLTDDVEPALIVFVHDRGLSVYQVALGGIVDETTIEGDVPNRHGQGSRVRGGASSSPHGASGGSNYERERKNQRHVEELIQRVMRDGVERLTKIWERDPRQHLVLVGTAEKVAGLERLLPARMQGALLARLPRPAGKQPWSGSGKSAMLHQTVDKLAERERASEEALVEQVIGEALRPGGMGVLGPEDVVLAVNERRVHLLVLEEDFQGSGWQCRNCGALGMTHDAECRFCQGPLAHVQALGEELASRVLAQDGEIDVVAHTDRLHAYDGVGAMLRQAHGKGLSGRESEAPGRVDADEPASR